MDTSIKWNKTGGIKMSIEETLTEILSVLEEIRELLLNPEE